VLPRRRPCARGREHQRYRERLGHGLEVGPRYRPVALTGEKPGWSTSGKHTEARKGKPTKKKQIRNLVVQFRDTKKMSWPKIVEYLHDNHGIHVSVDTARRAWDEAHVDEIGATAKKGQNLRRGQSTRISVAVKKEIATALGVGVSTVYWENRKL